MDWTSRLKADPLPWLLEATDPGVRYLALRDVAGSATPAQLRQARKAAHESGPIATILARMNKEGWWAVPGPGYSPKYRSTVWSVIMLAQLGASLDQDERIGQACAYVLEHALAEGGQFTASGAPSGTADCLQGNLCWALLTLGCNDPRLEGAYEWMARSVTGEGIASAGDRSAPRRYFASGNSGPTFACGSNNKLPCAWGAAKVMMSLASVPEGQRTPLMQRALRHGIDFLFSVDPADATYPSGYSAKPSGNWWKFGFPTFYVSDLLEIVEALVLLGHGRSRRLSRALDIISGKQDADGRWPLEYDYAGKTWVDLGRKKLPNKWVTLRALRILKAVGG